MLQSDPPGAPNKHKGTVKATPEQVCGGALLAHVLEGTETQGHSTGTTHDMTAVKAASCPDS